MRLSVGSPAPMPGVSGSSRQNIAKAFSWYSRANPSPLSAISRVQAPSAAAAPRIMICGLTPSRAASNAFCSASLIAKRIAKVTLGAYAHRDYLRRRGTPRQLQDLLAHDLVGVDRDETLLIEEPRPHTLQVTLNRPDVANAMNTQMGLDLLALFDSLHAAPNRQRCVAITGAGSRAFCATRAHSEYGASPKFCSEST